MLSRFIRWRFWWPSISLFSGLLSWKCFQTRQGWHVQCSIPPCFRVIFFPGTQVPVTLDCPDCCISNTNGEERYSVLFILKGCCWRQRNLENVDSNLKTFVDETIVKKLKPMWQYETHSLIFPPKFVMNGSILIWWWSKLELVNVVCSMRHGKHYEHRSWTAKRSCIRNILWDSAPGNKLIGNIRKLLESAKLKVSRTETGHLHMIVSDKVRIQQLRRSSTP